MATDGQLVLYRTGEPVDARTMLGAVLDVLSPTGPMRIYRLPSPCQAWEHFQAEVHGGANWTPIEILGSPDLPETISNRANLIEVLAAYSPEHVLTVTDIPCDLAKQIRRAVQEGVPEAIRGEFDPGNVEVVIGQHDLFDTIEHMDGFLFARPFLSIQFYGYGIPRDCAEARHQILELPEVQALRRLFEGRIGPLQVCVYWNG